jgi:hypothetical protein
MLDRLFSVLVALSLAFLVWLYVRSRDEEILDNVPVPVQIALAAGLQDQYVLEVTGPSQVPVSFTGPPARMRELRGLLQRGELAVEVVVTVPDDRSNESSYRDTVRVETADLHGPPGVKAMVAEGRNRIPVTLHRLVERRLPVRWDQSLEDWVGQLRLEPSVVLVRGPQDVLDRVRSIPVQPVHLPTEAEAQAVAEPVEVGPIPVVHEIDGHAVRVTPPTVSARLTLQLRQKVYELSDVPVQFLCPANFPLRPRFVGDGRDGRISLRVVGPTSAEPAVVALIDLTRRRFEPGFNEEPVRLQLPKDFHLAQEPPRPVPFRLEPLDPAGPTTPVVTPP